MGRRLNLLASLVVVGLLSCGVKENGGGSLNNDLTVSRRDLTADTPNAVGDLGNGIQWSTVSGTYGVASQTLVDQHTAIKGRIASPHQVGNLSTPTGPTAETLTWAAAKDPNEPVNFTLVLPERAFSWDLFRGATDTERASLIQQRQADLAPVQATVISKLSALGGQNMEGMWLANLVRVTLPASVASQLASWPEVGRLEHDVPIHPAGTGTPGDGIYGTDRRISTHADRPISHGFTGLTGNAWSPSLPVRIADVGSYQDTLGNNNSVPSDHPGFMGNGSTRFTNNWICYPSGYCASDTPPTDKTHDEVVMGVMAGSIENGQDPTFTGSHTTPQVDRSGIAGGAALNYYRASATTTAGAAAALEAAVNEGSDIVNNSWGVTASNWTTSDPTTDFSGFNEILQNAYGVGILVVFSEGDFNAGGTFSTACNSDYPANRPDVLAVNGSATTYDNMGNPPTTPTLQDGAWSTSGCTIDVLNSDGTYSSRYDREVGAVAPGNVGLNYSWGPYTSYYNGSWAGSSFSAPIVAGAAALLRDMWNQMGYGIRTNYFLKTDLMMLTDGYAFSSYSDGGTPRLRGGTSPYSGTGRLQMRSLYDFTHGSWQWSWINLTLYNGALYTKTIPSNIQNYRFAMFWEETDLTHVADIDVWVDALDSTGAVCQSQVASQLDYSIVNAIHLKASDIPACALSGGSLRLSVHAYAIPSGQNRVARYSDLWDNEPTY